MGEKLIILLAEDDPNDVMLMQMALAKSGLTLPVQVATDGADAMAYLKGEGQYADREQYPFPRVLITDIKMPRVSGLELLKWLQDHPECNLIPKIVLSSSQQEKDVTRAYQLGTNCYFVKPRTFSELKELVRVAIDFWSACELPDLPANC